MHLQTPSDDSGLASQQTSVANSEGEYYGFVSCVDVIRQIVNTYHLDSYNLAWQYGCFI